MTSRLKELGRQPHARCLPATNKRHPDRTTQIAKTLQDEKTSIGLNLSFQRLGTGQLSRLQSNRSCKHS